MTHDHTTSTRQRCKERDAQRKHARRNKRQIVTFFGGVA